MLSAEHAHRVLKGISDADCIKLGFNPMFCRPDWMIITVLPHRRLLHRVRLVALPAAPLPAAARRLISAAEVLPRLGA